MHGIRRRLLDFTALALSIGMLSGLASAADDGINITLITKDSDNHFWTAMVEGAEKAAKENNAQITRVLGSKHTFLAC